MIKNIFTVILLVATSQSPSFSYANEKKEIVKQIEREKITLETGRPRDPNISRSEFNKQRILRIRELNEQLKKLEIKK